MKHLIVLAIILLATTAQADPAPVLLQVADPAPFQGWLVSMTRAANLVAKIETMQMLLDIEEGRGRDLEALYTDALQAAAVMATTAILEASERSWWERHSSWLAPTMFIGGALMGGLLVYKAVK